MKPSTVLRRAAELCETNRSIGGCAALGRIFAGNICDADVIREYHLLVAPEHGEFVPFGYWFGVPKALGKHNHDVDWCRTTPEQHNHRILSLLMAAAIAESEGK